MLEMQTEYRPKQLAARHKRNLCVRAYLIWGELTILQHSFDQALIEVWRQALVENAKFVHLGSESHPVGRTSKRGLRQVEFVFEGHEMRGLEQNPLTKSQWALMARSGKKVMQFLQNGRYVANVVDGKVTIYGGRD